MFIVTAEEMREIEKNAVNLGLSNVILMENAGASVARDIRKRFCNKSCTRIIILSGHGNNGGDGFVVARHLNKTGFKVMTWFIGDEKRLSEESENNFKLLINSGNNIEIWEESKFDNLKKDLLNADIIVDSLLGTGFKGELKEPIRSIVEYCNSLDKYKVAVDIPTGVNSNNGQVDKNAFVANITYTFELPKVGHLVYPGAGFVGELVIEEISIPSKVINETGLKKRLITAEMVRNKLPIRSPDSHKGTYGHALLVGGSKNMPGAPFLATRAALTAGAGLASLAIPKSIQNMICEYIPEAICIGLPEQSGGYISLDSLEFFNNINEKYDVLSFGMGIGLWDDGIQLLESIVKKFLKPIVIDADGLNILSHNLSLLHERIQPIILTPHPGEMARLIKKSVEYIQSNRIEVSIEFAEKYGVYLVLKGANTIIATPTGNIYVNRTGGPELAKGGTGDILSGMITGFISQKIAISDALIIAVFLHGLSAELAIEGNSNYSLLASEVVDNLGKAIYHLMSNHESC